MMSKYRHETEDQQVIKNHQLEAYISDCVEEEGDESETEKSVKMKDLRSTEEEEIVLQDKKFEPK